MVESGSIDFIAEDLEFLADEEIDEEEEKTNLKSVNYFKMSSALGKIKDFGATILPPNINKSTFTFSPDVELNTIYFGLMGITRIRPPLIYTIMENRPYTNLKDFLEKVKVNKLQATMLIKSGAFDEFGEREKILYDYCEMVADIKTNLTLQNMRRIVELNLLPKELKKEEIIYKLNVFLRKQSRYGDLLLITPGSKPYIDELNLNFIQYDDTNAEYMLFLDWEKYYKTAMNPVRNWIKENKKVLLEKVNQAAINDLWNKYGKGNKASWEMEALSYYHSYHELEVEEYKTWLEKELKISNFFDLPEEPTITWQGKKGGKKFALSIIAGTSIGRDKSKNIVGLLTPEGFVSVRIYRSTFVKYDKQIKQDGLTEKSWFTKGNKLLIQGYRNGDTFWAKTYKGMGQMLHLITDVKQLKSKRLGEE